MRVPYETMLAEFERVLKKHGFSADRAHDAAETDAIVDAIAVDMASSQPVTEGGEVRCPGMGEHRSRKENLELGIPVAEEKWNEVLAM